MYGGKKILLVTIFCLFIANFCWGSIPAEFRANYRIEQQREEILEIFVRIEALRKTGEPIDTSVFSRLNRAFTEVFPNMPTNPNFKIIYEQCLITTQELSQLYDSQNFAQFSDHCFEDINNIIKQINAKYAVQANITANPKSGPAPLTVTFDARASKDPSNDTIPERNYFWYFKDTKGQEQVIGQGPVVNYTFNDPGNYVIHLTVRSVNSLEEGIFDGEKSINIDVAPQSANISAYLNGRKLKELIFNKIGAQEARRGLIIDGTSTTPTGGRRIISHRREINGKTDKFTFSQDGTNNPGVIRVELPGNGEYSLKLSTTDNENNKLTKEFLIVITDPVSVIKSTPDQGNTATSFTFDSSSSYSVISSIRSYLREIFDDKSDPIDSVQTKTLQKIFPKPGNYTIKLTVYDEANRTDIDQIKLFVESTPPIPQFIFTPTQKRKNPSQFVFDASPTTDIDVINGYDTIKFDWSFSNQEKVKVEKIIDDGKQVIVSFNEAGKYKVKLIVTDSYGKISEITKDLDIKSSLRPVVIASPIATTRGNTINFLLKANKTIASVLRDFGDNFTKTIQGEKITHIYDQVGTYTVKTKVSTPNGEENEVYNQIFIGEKNQPILAYMISNDKGQILSPDTSCFEEKKGNMIEIPAYTIDRYQGTVIDTKDSVNTKGENGGLTFFFKPQGGEIVKRNSLSHKFSDLGCQYIDVTVEDITEAKNVQRRIWFNVQNSLPVLTNLTLGFPQYGNDTGIGVQNNQIKDIFAIEYDPLIVKVIAQGAKDLDGFISHYIFYYYKTEDPDNIIELKITPPNIPYAFFSIPRIAGQYSFGVRIIDNDGGDISSENILGQGPLVFFPPSNKNPDIPIVTLKASSTNVKVGDTVKFEVISRIISNKPDFISNRSIKFDFDGDGVYDLTTKSPTVDYIYTKEGSFRPRVKVIYREKNGQSGIKDPIIVQKGLKAKFVAQSFGTKVIFRDTSYGEIDQTIMCMDLKQCSKVKKYMIEGKNYFIFDYEKPGEYTTRLDVKDKFGNNSADRQTIIIKNAASGENLGVLSIPQVSLTDKTYTIDVGKNLNNSVLYYIAFKGSGDCFMDKDILFDSDKDGNKEQDRDIKCNALVLQKYNERIGGTISRIYYQKDTSMVKRDLFINFLDMQDQIPVAYKDAYEKLSTIINKIESSRENDYLKTSLLNLRNSLGDKNETNSYIVQIKDLFTTNTYLIDENLHKEINEILDSLADKSVAAALGSTPYDSSKNEILIWLNPDAKTKVRELLDKLDTAGSNKDVVVGLLDELLNIIKDEYTKGQIDDITLNNIKTEICIIAQYKEVQTPLCGTDVTATGDQQSTVVETPKTTESSGGSRIGTALRWTLIILGIIAGVFVLLVIVFAIKGKLQQKKE